MTTKSVSYQKAENVYDEKHGDVELLWEDKNKTAEWPYE